ncbi:MAG: hypothetical protein U5R06_12040 [candidate division KSB1 bacterium]|nr:hypothetical protein [candidate division KSB1 bacterium]
MDSSETQIQAAIQAMEKAGIQCYGCGVVYMNSEREIRQAFEYARIAESRQSWCSQAGTAAAGQ